MLWPVVTYTSAAGARVNLWLGSRNADSVDVTEPRILLALQEAHRRGGSNVCLEVRDNVPDGDVVLTWCEPS